MQLIQYQQLAQRTEKALDRNAALQHGMLGVITEAGELGDAIKRAVIYGKDLDTANVEEELGDLLWYMAVIANNLQIDLGAAAARNIEKLRVRHPEKYTDADALARADKTGAAHP